jgi:hypothetical protein
MKGEINPQKKRVKKGAKNSPQGTFFVPLSVEVFKPLS